MASIIEVSPEVLSQPNNQYHENFPLHLDEDDDDIDSEEKSNYNIKNLVNPYANLPTGISANPSTNKPPYKSSTKLNLTIASLSGNSIKKPISSNRSVSPPTSSTHVVDVSVQSSFTSTSRAPTTSSTATTKSLSPQTTVMTTPSIESTSNHISHQDTSISPSSSTPSNRATSKSATSRQTSETTSFSSGNKPFIGQTSSLFTFPSVPPTPASIPSSAMNNTSNIHDSGNVLHNDTNNPAINTWRQFNTPSRIRKVSLL